MPRMRSLVLTIVAILVAAFAAADYVASAADDCPGRPNAGAPQGKHWYYRLDHAAHRKCWFLGPKGTRAVGRAVPKARHPTARRAAPILAPRTAARQVAPRAFPSVETAAIVTPAATGETHDAAFVSRWVDAADAV